MSEFVNIQAVAKYFRSELEQKKYLLLFAYNGTGKTRLSMEFKNLCKQENDSGEAVSDTLYFNAFTEDLFTWDNDLENDRERVLKLNPDSRFFAGLESLEMENRIRPFLHRYADFDFVIDYSKWQVSFNRTMPNEAYDENASDNADQERERVETDIKISRGEENIFVWCFFMAIVEIAMDKDIEAYGWVKYIYVDDPVSSLDENNIIAIAHHLAQLLKRKESSLKAVISSHHTLFFNVMWNELDGKNNKFAAPYFLNKLRNRFDVQLRDLIQVLSKLNAGSKTNVLNKIKESYPDTEVPENILDDKDILKIFITEAHATSVNPVQSFLDTFQSKLQGGKLKTYESPLKEYYLKGTGDTPFFHHVATLVDLYNAVESGKLYTHHFNTLRTILEKSACFHGFNKFSALIQKDKDDPDDILYTRVINVLNHGNYSLYEPMTMIEENKDQFKTILTVFMNKYTFNPELFIEAQEEV
jgi:hypothetical protein